MQIRLNPFVDDCPECGFDIRVWDVPDAIRTIRYARDLVALACESMDPALLDAQIGDLPSIADHVESLTDVLRSTRNMIMRTNEDDRHDSSLQSILDTVHHEATATGNALRNLTSAELDAALPDADTGHETVELAIRHLAHAVLHQQAAIGRTRRSLGDALTIGVGEVIQVSGSGGGLPKTPLLTARVDKSGVVGDRQASRRHHGAPFQALCLFSAEVIEDFAAQGHPITYGSAGENVTIRGLKWAGMRAGAELQIGDVLCRLTAPAVPCSQNAPWFTDGDFTRLSHDKHPGHSRWYASVITGGAINPGDPVHGL
ncbi:MAG: MOSC domain-containing protein [Acidimicrobiia bacterium]|nr:MOSC domain-containing protein [Acidimicrobiia bacterium]MDH5504773.1 MOSC domain-containing protein [Acidimicrobiia bacterium]